MPYWAKRDSDLERAIESRDLPASLARHMRVWVRAYGYWREAIVLKTYKARKYTHVRVQFQTSTVEFVRTEKVHPGEWSTIREYCSDDKTIDGCALVTRVPLSRVVTR